MEAKRFESTLEALLKWVEMADEDLLSVVVLVGGQLISGVVMTKSAYSDAMRAFFNNKKELIRSELWYSANAVFGDEAMNGETGMLYLKQVTGPGIDVPLPQLGWKVVIEKF